MGARENPAQREAWHALGVAGAVVYRINTGTAWAGYGRRQPDGSILIQDGRRVCLGYADVRNEPVVGTGDLAGYLPVVVTPEMVGHTIAVYLNPEAKPAKGGRVTADQLSRIEQLQRDGAIAGIVRGGLDVQQMLADWWARFHRPK